ncbi:MAG: hypothetical protein AB8F26_06980 [Phycisphaerales bacterium]
MTRLLVILTTATMLAYPLLVGFVVSCGCCSESIDLVEQAESDHCCPTSSSRVETSDREDPCQAPERTPCQDGQCPDLCCAVSVVVAVVRTQPPAGMPALTLQPRVENQHDPHADSHTLGLNRPPRPFLAS